MKICSSGKPKFTSKNPESANNGNPDESLRIVELSNQVHGLKFVYQYSENIYYKSCKHR